MFEKHTTRRLVSALLTSTAMAHGSAWAYAMDCDDLTVARTSSIEQAKSKADKSYEDLQTERDATEECLVRMGDTLNSLVRATGFSSIADVMGTKLDEAACRQIVQQSQRAIHELNQQACRAAGSTGVVNGVDCRTILSGVQSSGSLDGASSAVANAMQKQATKAATSTVRSVAQDTGSAIFDGHQNDSGSSIWDSMKQLYGQ